MKKRILDIIVPVYGKDPTYIYDNFNYLIKLIPENIGIIFVYKNSPDNSLNYDFLNNWVKDNVIVKKMNSKVKKTKKMISGFSLSNAEWILSLDSHHKLSLKHIKKLTLILINSKNKNLIWLRNSWLNLDNKKLVKRGIYGYIKVFNAGKYIIRSSLLKNSDNIEYDVIFGDDYTFGLYASFHNELFAKNFYKNFYIRTFGTTISSTHNWYNDTKLNKERILNDFLIIFHYWVDPLIANDSFKLKNTEFKRSIYFLFKNLYRLKSNLIYNTKENYRDDKIIYESLFNNDWKSYYKIINNFRTDSFQAKSFLRYKISKKKEL